MKKTKVTIDRDLCIGAATCVAVAPKTFNLDDEAKVIFKGKDKKTTKLVIDDSMSFDDQETILKAAQSCPVAAIIIEDEKGNRLWPKY